jgi:hypothetical protein
MFGAGGGRIAHMYPKHDVPNYDVCMCVCVCVYLQARCHRPEARQARGCRRWRAPPRRH